MEGLPSLQAHSPIPLYRQLFEHIAEKIRNHALAPGERLPATRELAGLLHLNRTTVSAAYELLEAEGLITGQVGRGSFVIGGRRNGVNWSELLGRAEPAAAPGHSHGISFVMSRPSRALFPLDDFRASCEAILARRDLADILQLGSPGGYEPLRRYLLDEARSLGLASDSDDLLITNGCQQGLDLIGRVLLRPGDAVAVEDPIYPGLKKLLEGMGARLLGIPVGPAGMEIDSLARVLEHERPRILIVTPNFQNPTGATLPEAARRTLLERAGAAGIPVVENDAYGELRYTGEELPSLKHLDQHDGTVLLRSFSKISFPGLRVGWALGPKPLLDRLRQAKEASDLHTDQLSQAVLLEFAQSGKLEAHRRRVLEEGRLRLSAVLDACGQYLPKGSQWTRPEGGMNVWVRVPAPLDAGELLPRAQNRQVAYLPGRYFAVSRPDPGALRLSFAGLTPADIRAGLEILGTIFQSEAESVSISDEPAPAMV